MEFRFSDARRTLVRTATALLLPAVGAASSHAQQAQARPLRVVTSFSILADMTREIAGSAADVYTLVGPNADAHTFEPSPADAQRIASADLVIFNGLRFEGWIDRLVRASGYRGPVVQATVDIAPRVLNGEPDPHAWQSLDNAKRYVENIRKALVAAAPDASASVNARAAAYSQRIVQLDRDIRAKIETIPKAHRRIATSHDAFGYFGAAYGIEFLPVKGWTTASEASAADVARIVREVRAQRIRAILVENIADPRLVERIASEAGIAVGGKLYSDAVSSPGTAASTYLKLMAQNVDTLVDAMRKTGTLR